MESGVARAWGQGLTRGLSEIPAKFNISCRSVGISPSSAHPDVTVDGPEGVVSRVNIMRCSNNNNPNIDSNVDYEVTYVPPCVGVYDISILCNGKPIPGKLNQYNILLLIY